jgi:DNA polymerase III alpha subunit
MLIKTDNLGVPRFTNKDLIDMIYSGHIDKCHVVLCEQSDDVEQFNSAMEAQGLPQLSKYIPLDVDQTSFDAACQSEWFMPEEYKNYPIYDYCLNKCNTPEQKQRVMEEFDAFDKHKMLNLLKYMKYLVDFMRENNIVWGVGRGSSVASYVLYLIGVHRIDSVQYDLDWREFLR